ncbi:MAG: hypothetical protein U9R57_13065 [Thermodesulfobacteriota bacterium]|nr:hypothetical protein [Thermodesulfobacteriota bacterium]
MKKSIHYSILMLLLLGISVGCAKRETRVDRFYGTSYELALQSQINNPEAGVIDGPSVGLEGSVASKVIERYEKGFEKPAAKTTTYSINVGGISAK